ncbi:hypothetical protein J2T02_004669 [Chitinophaga terrae (ex Kim and Jung 2007)]|uniref:hypothetical protein n=1 Tax=Chitinophaga terrae (ex Kim and Jung 2007) TaxID=408074 RepID=UPI002786E27A|nr:hypothetical protein [Chitinophaga terrae (ex Kim and Jung 2007)]MDQ0109525.1 hypothetical protein [Chitinophaga terrae (ex Kim and Jung 2007)]
MHNPLAILSEDLLDALLLHGHKYFVRQSYPRGLDHFDGTLKEAFLFSAYKELQPAEKHYLHLASDPRRHIYYIGQEGDIKRMRIAASQPAGYRAYSDKLATREWEPANILKSKVKNYLRSNIKWRSKDAPVDAQLFLEYGELMLSLSNGKQVLKIKLSEVERL